VTTDQPHNGTAPIRAPWTNEQVFALNRYQRDGWMHPFNCPNEHPGDHRKLTATDQGWRCPEPGCDYRQDWAHAFMAEPAPSPYAFTWAETVASRGTGDTAVIEIDVHAIGHAGPVPVEIPLAEARILHEMLGDVLAEHDPDPGAGSLRGRIAGARPPEPGPGPGPARDERRSRRSAARHTPQPHRATRLHADHRPRNPSDRARPRQRAGATRRHSPPRRTPPRPGAQGHVAHPARVRLAP